MTLRYTPMVPRPGEIWKPVVGAPDYIVSNLARVARVAGSRKTAYTRLIFGGLKDTGYWQVMLTIDGKLCSRKPHIMVAEAFIRPRVAGDVVNHLDGNKLNNVLSNLEITTKSGNNRHAVSMGLIRSGSSAPAARLTDEEIRDIRRRFAAGEKARTIAPSFGISASYANQIKRHEYRSAA